jgi:DNA polymerase I-like protein with 3'-5' exonuclease and polymerase domains
MLINCDVKGLEVVVAAQLSGDKVLGQEIIEGQNIHENNRSAFNLPTRLIAKVFKFRLIYGGSAYSYANDPDFMAVSREERFWQDVIDRYYTKYYGIAEWHKEIVGTAQCEGKLSIPSGRWYPFPPEKDFRGNLKWPITKIKNYPVQGFGADLVMLARLEAAKKLRTSGLEYKLISTVHDSIVVDTPEENWYTISMVLKNSVEAVPSLCRQVWGYDFKLPLTCEIQKGPNKKDMEEIKFN